MNREGFEKPRVYRVKKEFSVSFAPGEECSFAEGTMLQLYEDGVLVDGLPMMSETQSHMLESFIRDAKRSKDVIDRIEVVNYNN